LYVIENFVVHCEAFDWFLSSFPKFFFLFFILLIYVNTLHCYQNQALGNEDLDTLMIVSQCL